MNDQLAIDIQNVAFQYPDGNAVLNNINCQVKHGEKIALIGPNGAGKSTFMSLLNGVLMPSNGEIFINGRPLTKENFNAIRRTVGIVFQDPDDQLFSPTVFDDVAFGPLNLGLDSDTIHHRVNEALSVVGLEGYEQRAPFHLSFGEKKRLALATVLSYQPDILVFDEPSTNMDPLNRRNLINWLRDTDKTVILCTHDLDIALEVCERCMLLADGNIVADGPSAELLYDRKLLESHHLEMPLAVMTHDLLHDLLHSMQIEHEHKQIIGDFLHTHRHVHGSDKRVHFHVHAHPHDPDHLHEDIHDNHLNDLPHHHHHDEDKDANTTLLHPQELNEQQPMENKKSEGS